MIMGILDLLIEKKNLMAYIGLRIEQVKKNKEPFLEICRNPEASNKEKKKAQRAIYRFNGRITELLRLKSIVNDNGLKQESKNIWRSLNK